MPWTRDELERAFERYCRLRDEASRTGDWGVWAAQFSADARYVEHAYGDLVGGDAIRDWITKVMAPFPTMTFPHDWYVIDVERGCVVFQCQNQMPEPFQPDGRPFAFPTWSKLHYAGNGLWSYEEDMYNPADGARAIGDWRKAGGKMRTRELVKMTNA